MLISPVPRRSKHQAGLSLIELLIAMAIGLFITGVVSFVFVDTSRSFREVRKSGEQIENGRYALNLLADDIRHAGYFGRLSTFPPLAAVDPCASPTLAHLAAPVQVYSTALNAKAAAPACLPAAEIAVGSDVIVVRRADTIPLIVGAAATGRSVADAVYLQANVSQGQIQLGSGGDINRAQKASGVAATVLNRDGSAAPIRRLHVHVYYVSPCSEAVCGGAGDGVPTLKRMELATAPLGSPLNWTVVPLVSGIEFLQVDLGFDTSPTVGSGINTTYLLGDGAADGLLVESPTGSQNWANLVSLRINLLARAIEPTPGHVETKRHSLGLAGEPVLAGAFKRKTLAAEVRLNNPSGRRERIPGEY